jgi:hypothetical protein
MGGEPRRRQTMMLPGKRAPHAPGMVVRQRERAAEGMCAFRLGGVRAHPSFAIERDFVPSRRLRPEVWRRAWCPPGR